MLDKKALLGTAYQERKGKKCWNTLSIARKISIGIYKVLGKGNKEGYAPFGSMTEQYLKLWLNEYQPKPSERIWDIGFWGVKSMLDELKVRTGLPCNPHSFRRGFCVHNVKSGLSNKVIQSLGGWESPDMVSHYAQSLTFEEALNLYKSVNSNA